MGTFLQPVDLAPFAQIEEAKAAEMIADAEAQAGLVAPCITDTNFAADANLTAALRSILRAAVLRWHEAGSGAVQTAISGPFSQTTQYQARRSMFWPSEITDLQKLCSLFTGETTRQAFGVDTGPWSTDWSTYAATDSWA